MVALMVPENANQKHLDLLGELAALMSSDTFRASLLAAPTVSDLHRLFLTAQVDAVSNA
jgi:mannitol/fructose-specific phosphotransferase system IIA component (Ntr-type)